MTPQDDQPHFRLEAVRNQKRFWLICISFPDEVRLASGIRTMQMSHYI